MSALLHDPCRPVAILGGGAWLIAGAAERVIGAVRPLDR